MTATNSVEQLLEAVKQLSPKDFSQFTTRLAAWDGPQADRESSERFLVRQTKLQMPAADAKRLRTLIDRSERGTLRCEDLEEYRRLVALAERVNASRVRALAELAVRRKQPISELKKAIGWREDLHGA